MNKENICHAVQYLRVFHDIQKCFFCQQNWTPERNWVTKNMTAAKIQTSCPRLHIIGSVWTYVSCHTIHYMTDDIMIKDMMAWNMISSAMDVDEFSTVVIKLYELFMVNELLHCHVFFVCTSRFYPSLTTMPTISWNFLKSWQYFKFNITHSCNVISLERYNCICIVVLCNQYHD